MKRLQGETDHIFDMRSDAGRGFDRRMFSVIVPDAIDSPFFPDEMGDFEFNGYIEGNNITKGDCNVIVTDGFTGNIALKTAEGTANFLTDNLKKALSANIFSKISSLLSYFPLKKFKNKLDPRKYNGAIFLGLKGPVVKSHGSTDSLGFSYSLEVCYKIAKGQMIDKIKYNLGHIKKIKSDEK